ncbi:hypothetical protein TNCV_547101 [Trichonephila clavipes]|nr:hypothetical protein TNCV_547101 [Trichonephila clavipes]
MANTSGPERPGQLRAEPTRQLRGDQSGLNRRQHRVKQLEGIPEEQRSNGIDSIPQTTSGAGASAWKPVDRSE